VTPPYVQYDTQLTSCDGGAIAAMWLILVLVIVFMGETK